MSNVNKNESGVAAILITTIIMFVGITITLSLVFVFANRIKAARNIEFGEQAYFTAEAGNEDALLRFLDPDKGIPASYTLPVGATSTTVTRSTDLFGNEIITSQSDVSSRARSVEIVLGLSPDSTRFVFAAQIGNLGLQMDSNSGVDGAVFSNGDITGAANTDITGDASSGGTISSPNPTVGGTKKEGEDLIPLPNFDAAAWEAAANINSDPIIGDHTLIGTVSFGPRKVVGNLTVDRNANLTVTGPIYVTGNILIENRAELFLDESYGSGGTVVTAEGTFEFEGNTEVYGTSATPKGYMMAASTSTSLTAIELNSNESQELILYAVNGTLVLNSNADVVSLAGEGIHLNSFANINYDLGITSYTFSAGGSGGFVISSWEEE